MIIVQDETTGYWGDRPGWLIAACVVCGMWIR